MGRFRKNNIYPTSYTFLTSKVRAVSAHRNAPPLARLFVIALARLRGRIKQPLRPLDVASHDNVRGCPSRTVTAGHPHRLYACRPISRVAQPYLDTFNDKYH